MEFNNVLTTENSDKMEILSEKIRVIPLTTDDDLQFLTRYEMMLSGDIRLDHPLQRCASNWNATQKGNLIRRILQGGKFSPLTICTQTDTNGCTIQWLIDGKQRLTTMREFYENDFSISRKIRDYMVTFDGILYERKVNKSGKFGLKKNRNGELIPILTEDGQKQKVVQTIDIRGLSYKDLPPELQFKFKNFIVPVQVKHKCTDKDIELEIIDYNSGSPMNIAQKGKAALGKDIATYISDLAEHRFILDKCGFNTQRKIKDENTRSISEALSLVIFGIDSWKSNYIDICDELQGNVTADDIEYMNMLFDELDKVVSTTEDMKKFLTNKEFFICIANFDEFMSNGKYQTSCYGDFLNHFIESKRYDKCIPTGNVDENGNEIYESYADLYGTGTKQKMNVQSRIEQMNEFLEEYLKEKCANRIVADEDVDDEVDDEDVLEVSTDEMVDNREKLSDFIEQFGTNKEAILTLLELDNRAGYGNDFTDENVDSYIEYFTQNYSQPLVNRCLEIQNKILNVDLSEEIILQEYNFPLFARLYNEFVYDEETEKKFLSWLVDFDNLEEPAYAEIGGMMFDDYMQDSIDQTSNSTIISKYAILQQSLQEYIEKEGKQ